MANKAIFYLVLIILQCEIILTQLINTKTSFNGQSSMVTINTFTRHYEPYMYRNLNGTFASGIEFSLMETIGQKLRKSIQYSNGLLSNSVNSTIP